MFITFEGGEGTGKSTAMLAVAKRLHDMGQKIKITSEPGGTPLGAGIRALLLGSAEPPCPQAELLLFLADRAQHVAAVIRPAIEKGEIVLCDRFEDSTVAYQGYGRKLLPPDELRSMSQNASGGIIPDLTLLFDAPVTQTLARAKSRNIAKESTETRFDNETLAFHEDVREGYLRMAEREPERFVIVDALMSPEDVAETCIKTILEHPGAAIEIRNPCGAAFSR